jgi:hypothetical protein
MFKSKHREGVDAPLETYSVIYRGGHPDYPKAKSGGLKFEVLTDRFVISPTMGTKSWFKGISIPYSSIKTLDIVARQLSSVEGILGGLDSRQLNQNNNIHVEYLAPDGTDILLRLEMMSGVTVMGQAKKCQEFLDRLRVHGIRSQFAPDTAAGPNQRPPTEAVDVPEQIAKLAALRDQGVLTNEEFGAKKTELLSRL